MPLMLHLFCGQVATQTVCIHASVRLSGSSMDWPSSCDIRKIFEKGACVYSDYNSAKKTEFKGIIRPKFKKRNSKNGIQKKEKRYGRTSLSDCAN